MFGEAYCFCLWQIVCLLIQRDYKENEQQPRSKGWLQQRLLIFAPSATTDLSFCSFEGKLPVVITMP